MTSSTDRSLRVYRNVWYHNSKYFATAPDPNTSAIERGLSANQKLVVLPAQDGAAFTDNLRPAWLTGNTLVVDFPFASYPTNMGHWLEVVIPAFDALADGGWAAQCQAANGHARALIGAHPALRRSCTCHHRRT